MELTTATDQHVLDHTEQVATGISWGDYLQLECQLHSSVNVTRAKNDTYCEPHHDLVHCWYAAKANTTVTASCPPEIGAPEHVVAVRVCGANGNWENITDYQQCIDFLDKIQPTHETDLTPLTTEHSKAVLVMRDIYFGCSLISLFCLCITLFVFCYFRSLQCSRVTIHKHLVVSFILRFIIIVFLFEPLVFGHDVYYMRVDWFCKLIIVLSQYIMVSNNFWMFVEGLFLHNSIVVTVFSTDAPFNIFCAIGWGLPGIIAVSWAVAMNFTVFTPCWQNNSRSSYSYIVSGSILLALIVNVFFLINIIRVLVTKLRANNTHESSRIKKAIRATVILMPLLGLTNLIMAFNPKDGGSYVSVYQVTNVVLHSNQGILISIFYCFLNGEVRKVIRQKYRRMKIQRILKNSSRRYSRTSSCILSQTETRGYQSSSSDSNICLENLNNNSYQKLTLITEVRDKPKSDSNININGDVTKHTASASDPSNLKSSYSVKFRLSSSENDIEQCKSPHCQTTGDDLFDLPSAVVSCPDIENGVIDIGVPNNGEVVPREMKNSDSDTKETLCNSDRVNSGRGKKYVTRPNCSRVIGKARSISELDETNAGILRSNRWSVLSNSDFKLNIVSGFSDEVTEEFLKLLKEKDS
ncbi:corticotropin-releasing factor receptor 2-like isoform X2 [Ostrea edulis]|uniref:corticotropin-releasing factor receptor 2-like isoform X2 n=1 Tax=Ostrea edulis TaxID=37623 RepID=UPI0020945E4A|nr:corticotropin-releasing factor receptor 2-like isoform X2 [Ostrea edulis]XP_056008378.1 corticotropin-releasing factor receptor 2-like isoform X2 [Ostrea edulis]